MSITNFFNELIMREHEDRRLMRQAELEHQAHEQDSAEWAAREISDTLVYDFGVSEDAGNALYDLLVDALKTRSSGEHSALVRNVKGYK